MQLVIGNKNYSSWSMRPWILLRQAGIAFEEVQLKFGEGTKVIGIDKYSAAGKVPVLIIDGERDLRPRWAVDSLERALPDVRRVVLPGAGHIPWLEKPGEFAGHLLGFLNQ